MQIEISARLLPQINVCTVIDGCALLWVPNWPVDALVQDYITKFKYHIGLRLAVGDVYLVFDRYIEFSTKYSARLSGGTGRVRQLGSNVALLAQKVVLNVTENKKQLIRLICQDLQEKSPL